MSCKLSPIELFSWKNKNSNISLWSTELAQRVVKVKSLHQFRLTIAPDKGFFCQNC